MNKQKQKEQLSLRIAKTALVIAVITGLGTIIFGGGVVIMKYYGNEANNRIVEPVEQETENYYNALEKKCAGGNCCLSSLKFMKENNYKEADKDYKCPDGFKAGGLKCESSLSWCEPMEENCKKHGEIPDYTAPGDDMSIQCCNGLKHKIQKKYFDENCVNLFEKYGGGGYAGICINCGDNICDAKFENECNCPEDCGENNLVSCCALECERYNFGNCPKGCTRKCVGSCPICGDCGGAGSCYCQENCDELEAIDTSDWQTYRNEEFGFEVKYPSYVNKIEESGNVSLDENRGMQLLFSEFGFNDISNTYNCSLFIKHKNSTNAISAMNRIEKYDWENYFVPKEINSLNGIMIQKDGYGTMNYYFVNTYFISGNYLYNFQLSGEEYDKNVLDEFNQILSTFKATD